MAIPITPSPPVGTVSKRPARPAERPEIKLTAAREESRFVGPLPLAIGLIALAAMAGFALHATGKIEDANFVQARDSLNQYELGRAETERDYDSPIYEEALAALAKVEQSSISAGPAATLAADIKFRTDAFHRRVKAREAAQAEVLQAKIDREAEFQAAHRMALMMPKKKDFPECDEGHTHAK